MQVPLTTIAAFCSAVGAAVGTALGDALGDALGLALGSALGEAEGSAVGTALGSALGAAVGTALGDALGDALGLALGSALGVEDVGFNIIYYPKYHCELNSIEMTWGWLKMKCRQRCTYKFDELKKLLPQLIENELPLWLVRRHARYCFRFMVGYENGLNGPLLEYAVKKYSSHRTIPHGIIASLEEEYEASLKSKKKKVLSLNSNINAYNLLFYLSCHFITKYSLYYYLQ